MSRPGNPGAAEGHDLIGAVGQPTRLVHSERRRSIGGAHFQAGVEFRFADPIAGDF
jgi:hypothetical protein